MHKYLVHSIPKNMHNVFCPSGPQVGPREELDQELFLLVNAKGAGNGKVNCVVVQPNGSEVDAQVTDNQDGTFDAFCTLLEPGDYIMYVRFGGENIPGSPFKVKVCQPILHSRPSRGGGIAF